MKIMKSVFQARSIYIFVFFHCILLQAKPLLAKEYEYRPLPPPRELSLAEAKAAENNYQKYCALCHGKDREGYANDHAPSLKSKSLFESSTLQAIFRPVAYGRVGTAMGGYLDDIGGPMSADEIWDLTYWLYWQSGAERVLLLPGNVRGDAQKGEAAYQKECAACHGKKGEGVNAPALTNQSALAHNDDAFIRYAIRHGRQDTPMPAFANKLSSSDIDNVTAFLRSKAGGWKQALPVLKSLPTPDQYILNPEGDAPSFSLKDNLYVSSKDLSKALLEKRKIILLDTRVASVWQVAHIEGAVPFPYYKELDEHINDLPRDVQIVAYCSCPRAMAEKVIKGLRSHGFKKTAVLWDGIFGWMHQGYPVARGDIQKLD